MLEAAFEGYATAKMMDYGLLYHLNFCVKLIYVVITAQ
jgi:hypothetical protein